MNILRTKLEKDPQHAEYFGFKLMIGIGIVKHLIRTTLNIIRYPLNRKIRTILEPHQKCK